LLTTASVMSLLPVGETILIAMGISAGFVSMIVFVLWLRHFRTTWQERLKGRRPQRSLSAKDEELAKRYSVASSTFGEPRETQMPNLSQSQKARCWESQNQPQQRSIINDTKEGTAYSGDIKLDLPSNERYATEPSNILQIVLSPGEIEEAKADSKVFGLEIHDTKRPKHIKNKHSSSSPEEDALLLSQWKQRISNRSEQLQQFLKMTAVTKSAMKSGAGSIDDSAGLEDPQKSALDSAGLEDPRKSAQKDDDEVGCLGIGPLCFCA